jgi:hypothetical protein
MRHPEEIEMNLTSHYSRWPRNRKNPHYGRKIKPTRRGVPSIRPPPPPNGELLPEANLQEEGAVLSATVEAVTWKSALDLDEGPRKGQRVVICRKEMTQLEQVLSTGDHNIDSADGHTIAYAIILQAAQSYEHPPIFLKEDSEQIMSNEDTALKVPMWMNIAAQVATGNRRMVLEDGPDKMNSDDDDALEEEHGDKLTGMYTSEMDPNKGPVKLTQNQVAVQKAAAHMLKAPPRSQSPVGGSSDEDEPTCPEWIWSQTKGCMRRNKHFRARIATEDSKAKTIISPAVYHIPTPLEKAPQGPSTPTGSASVSTVNVPPDTLPVLTKGKKGSVAKKGAGKKAAVATPVARPADSEDTQPMATRQRGSRAGNLRPSVGGSGQTDTCVASSHPSKT